VDERCLEIDAGEAGDDAILLGSVDTLLHTGHEFPRYRPTHHPVFELIARARRQRLEADLDPRELPGAAGLLLVRIVLLHFAADGLAISDLRRADIGVDLELALHAIDDDLEVKLAHALDHRLSALRVHRDPEGRILLGQTVQGHAHLL